MEKRKLTAKEYNEAVGLRSTDIKRILTNPYSYIKGIKQTNSKALGLGAYAHALLLEPEAINKEFVVIENGKGITSRTNEAIKKGLIPIGKDEALNVYNAIESLKSSEVYNLFKGCENEISCFKSHLLDNKESVTLKCKIDALGSDYILDFKTTSLLNGASPDNFVKNCANFGYYIQAAFYMMITGIKKFLFVVLELNPPYMIGLYTLDNPSLDFGLDEVNRALNIYKNINKFATNIYINQDDFSKVQTLTLPNWVYYRQ